MLAPFDPLATLSGAPIHGQGIVRQAEGAPDVIPDEAASRSNPRRRVPPRPLPSAPNPHRRPRSRLIPRQQDEGSSISAPGHTERAGGRATTPAGPSTVRTAVNHPPVTGELTDSAGACRR